DLVTGVAFAPDGRRALSVSVDQEVFLWDLDRGASVNDFSFKEGAKYLNSVAFTPDGGRCLLCAGRTVYLVDLKTSKVLHTFNGHTGWVMGTAFSADGKRLLTGGDDRTVRLWDTESGQTVRVFAGHEGGVKSVAFSPDGRYLLSGGNDATVR